MNATCARKVPSPLPRRTLTLTLPLLAVTRSRLPSPSRSPSAIPSGLVPAALARDRRELDAARHLLSERDHRLVVVVVGGEDIEQTVVVDVGDRDRGGGDRRGGTVRRDRAAGVGRGECQRATGGRVEIAVAVAVEVADRDALGGAGRSRTKDAGGDAVALAVRDPVDVAGA